MIWPEFPVIDWQLVVLDPVFLFLACWFASGFLLAAVPSQWRVLGFALVGISLQGIMRGPSLPAFELVNVLVYLYAVVIRRWIIPKSKIEQGEINQPPAAEAEARRWTLCCLGMIVLIVVAFALRDFLAVQHTSVEAFHVRWALLVLDFFQLLRLISFLHEFGSGYEELPAFQHFILWANLPPIGMIVRLSEFMSQLEPMSRAPDWAEVFHGRQLLMLCLGFCKWGAGFALGSIAEAWFSAEYEWVYKWGRVFVFGPWSFYLLSAGMVDVQTFIARTWNLNLPMAWNWPFIRTNLSAFWANFNMTMTSFYRDYLFFARWGLSQPNLYLNAMIVFVAMGVWHDLNWYWLIFGIYHGLGFCVYLWFQQVKKKYALGPWMSSWPVVFACWLTTYVFVCLSWLVPSKIVVSLGLG